MFFPSSNLICKRDGIAVLKIDLDLSGSSFLDDGIDLETLSFGIVVYVIYNRAVFFNRAHAVGLMRDSLSPGSTDGWFDWQARVGIGLGEIELELWRNNRCPALVPEK